jgi:hypothetical protein
MAPPAAWSPLDWTCPVTAGPWLETRVLDLAALIRRFELAFQQSADGAQGDELQAAFDTAAETLVDWDAEAAKIYAHTTRGEGKPVPPEPAYARELKLVYDQLQDLRAQILEQLGDDAAALLLDAEGRIEVGREAFRPAAPKRAPTKTQELRLERFAADLMSANATAGPPAKPVTVDEIRMRTAAEQKPLPESRSLGALLAILPSDWVRAVFAHLELSLDDQELTAGSRAAMCRGIIFESLRQPPFLAKVIGQLLDVDRALLSQLLQKKDGLIPYTRVAQTFGHDEADGFYWYERPPSGPLARLRRSALAFVGTRGVNVTVALPSDLAGAIREILEQGKKK